MISRGHHPGMAHFQRFGPLAYRLALAMLGEQEAAAQALEVVFAGFGREGALWPQWHVAIGAIHRHCAAVRNENAQAVPPAAALQPDVTGDDDSVTPPAATVFGAINALSPADRETLWGVLTTGGGRGWEELADALRRLEVAISNEGIPSEEEADWHE